MDKSHKMFRIAYTAARILITPFYPIKAVGRENIPEGAALMCGNHSHWTDPFLMAFAITSKEHTCFMAKVELFKNKLLNRILTAIGTFPVDRDAADLDAIRIALRRLKSGKKVGIFPEGTRSAEDDAVSPKSGAIRLAEQAGAPLVPVYIPRKKKLFRRNEIVIGKPIIIEKQRVKRSREEYEHIAEELMETIRTLGTDDKEKSKV